MMKYIIYASLYEEIDAGWVWMSQPQQLPSRCVVAIRNRNTGKRVFCEALHIDSNFTERYNEGRHRHKLDPDGTSLVINAWYRKRLGDIRNQSKQDLYITAEDNSYGKLRACLQHPQVAIRMGTWLGIISLGLGVLGVILAMI